MGVRGMNLVDRDEVIGMQIDSQGTELLIVSNMVWVNVLPSMNLQPRTVAVKA